MLKQAMYNFISASRQHKENAKAQYTDKTGEKNYFRASELGTSDRKLIYGFFKHIIPHDQRSPHNLEQLENGDYVHDRYQNRWNDMGVLVSMEQRLTSKDDEYLAQYDWEAAGHYDGELDVNVIRAHALGLCTVVSEKNEETGEYELIVELDEAYAESIGIFEDDYVPTTLIADIKTMNPWGWKRIFEKSDVSDIQAYIDQITFYMYQKNTPYGNIYIESKDNNMPGEVQIVWKDMHEGVEYGFDPEIFGELEGNVVRVVVDSDRFFGNDKIEGIVPRIERQWTIVKALREAAEIGDNEAIARLMPPRCSDTPEGFPCSWKTGRCEFYEHCWNSKTGGNNLFPIEACPPEFIWSFEDDNGEVQVDTRKVPEGIDYDGFIKLVEMGALDYTKFLVEGTEPEPAVSLEEAQETALNADNLFDAGGELILGKFADEAPVPAPVSSEEGGLIQDAPAEPNTTKEYTTESGEKAIDCINCGKQVTYTRLGNGGTKKCGHCKHTNRVAK